MMKNSCKYYFLLLPQIIFTVLFFCQPAANSQDYVPFPDSSASWRCYYSFSCSDGYSPSNSFIYNYCDIYFMSGDTLIDSLLYIKLYHYADTTDTAIYAAQYIGAIREDSLKKVYFRQYDDTADIVIYDFDMNIGDTLEVNYNGSTLNSILVGHDSVIVGNTYRKVHLIEYDPGFYYSDSEDWIEGIGSMLGLFYFTERISRTCVEDKALSEFHLDSTLLYEDPNVTCSTYVAVDEVADEHNTVAIHPNPFSDKISIEINSSEKLQNAGIYIFDIMGRRVGYVEVKTLNKKQWDLSFLPKGVYTLQLGTQRTFYTQKLIKR